MQMLQYDGNERSIKVNILKEAEDTLTLCLSSDAGSALGIGGKTILSGVGKTIQIKINSCEAPGTSPDNIENSKHSYA